MTIAFFGHRDSPYSLMPYLEREIESIIGQYGKATFLVGTHGNFDGMVRRALIKSAAIHPEIACRVVLAYLPESRKRAENYGLPTIFPEGIETVPKRFAINYRNNYMIERCDIVVCRVKDASSVTGRLVKTAERRGKTIIKIGGDLTP